MPTLKRRAAAGAFLLAFIAAAGAEPVVTGPIPATATPVDIAPAGSAIAMTLGHELAAGSN